MAEPNHRRPCLLSEDGQGLIELIVALMILAIAIGALLTVMTASAVSLQRSDQKGTALVLAEKQIEIYRNLPDADIRLSASELATDIGHGSADPYNTANSADGTIPSSSGQITDASNPCSTPLPPECLPEQTVTGPDRRQYRVDTYITAYTPTNGTPIKLVTVIVRNAQLSTFPILARSSSTFSTVSVAFGVGKAITNLALDVPAAVITGGSVTAQATLTNGQAPSGAVTVYYVEQATAPTSCSGGAWVQAGQTTVSDNGAFSFSVPISSDGTYWWYATYDGDLLNKPATTTCGGTMPATVARSTPWNPTVTMTAASVPATGVPNVNIPASSISATIASSSGATTALLTFKVFGPLATAPNPCTSGGTTVGAGTTVDGDGTYGPTTGFTPTAGVGKYWWYATYPGDSTNSSASSACGASMVAVTDVQQGPQLTALQMFDTNGNGKVDRVVATFDKTLAACAAPCTTGWTLSNVPSAGTLSSVAVAGTTATLTLTEGASAADTSVGAFTVQLDSSSGITDATSRHAAFAATPPADKAGPVLVSASTTAGSTTNKMQSGDTLDLTFSEAVTAASVGATATVKESRSGQATLTIPTLIQSASIASSYLGGNNSSGTSTGAVTLINGNKTVHVVLGAVSTTGSGVGTGSNGAALKPVATIMDASGNAASTTPTATANPLF